MRLLTQEDYGNYRQVWLTINALVPFFLLGAPAALYYFVPGAAEERRRSVFMLGLAVLVSAGFVFSAALFFGAEAIGGFYNNPDLPVLLRAAALYGVFALPSFGYFHYLVAVGRPGRGTLLSIAFFLLQAVAVLTLVLRGYSLETVFWAVSAVVLLRFLHLFWDVPRLTHGSWSGSPIATRRFLAYSVPVAVSALALSIGQRLDKVIVGNMLSLVDFAQYSVGAVEFPGVVLLATAANTVMRPHIAELHHEGKLDTVARFWRESYRRQSLALIPMGAFLVFFATPFIELLYTDAYRRAIPVFQIYLFLVLFRMAPPEVILTSLGKPRWVLYGVAVSIGLNLALTLWLIRVWGMAGPPAATVIAALVAWFWLTKMATGLLNIRIRDAIPWARILGVIALSLGLAFVCSLIPVSGWQALVLGGLAFLILYVLLAKAFGLMLPRDWELLRGWLSLSWLRRR
ncbi:MAG: polysaccharide biosynthesis protein [Candidatus Eisenbacteria bacterium]|uniref:Polysaccharide biosynthesis protein n=1 Tax=Eiseniibacteriota bacterium TaxID=2212470 RepID=A0A7Y2ECC4_UNCEI|nr:polysaccharide biosynthesis protein [Candidatus Eisenbacteria bacterium]